MNQYMSYEVLRLQSFRDARYGDDIEVPIIHLAQAGFYFDRENGRVLCFSCGCEYNNQFTSTSLKDLHRPNCRYLELNQTIQKGTQGLPCGLLAQHFNLHRHPSQISDFSRTQPHEEHKQITSSVNGHSSNVHSDSELMQSAITNGHSANGPSDSELLQHSSNVPTTQFRETSSVTPTTASPVTSLELHNNTNGSSETSIHIPGPPTLNLSSVSYPQFSSRDARLKTFANCNPAHSHPPDDLAAAGFFYAGYADCVRCFCCGLGLKFWRPDDVITYQHARLRPACVFNRLYMGQQYVDDVQREIQDQQGASNHVTNQGGSNHVANQGGSNHVANQGGSNHVTNQGASNHVTNQGASNHVTNQRGSIHVTNQGASNHVTNQGASNHVTNQGGSNHVINKRGSNHVTNQGGSNHVTNQGAYSQVTNQGGSNHVTNQGASNHVTNQGGSNHVTNQGASNHVTNQRGSIHVTNQGASNHATNQGASNHITNQGASNHVTNQGGRIHVTNQGASNHVINQGANNHVTNQTSRSSVTGSTRIGVRGLEAGTPQTVSALPSPPTPSHTTAHVNGFMNGEDSGTTFSKHEVHNSKNEPAAPQTNHRQEIPTQDPHEELRVMEREQILLAERTTCRICHSKPVSCIFLPCGHVITCQECADKATRCILCDKVIIGTANIFLA